MIANRYFIDKSLLPDVSFVGKNNHPVLVIDGSKKLQDSCKYLNPV